MNSAEASDRRQLKLLLVASRHHLSRGDIRSLIEFLEEKEWKGIVLLDDIGPQWPEIEDFWNRITFPKINVTEVGHMSGTGLVNFDEKHTVSWL